MITEPRWQYGYLKSLTVTGKRATACEGRRLGQLLEQSLRKSAELQAGGVRRKRHWNMDYADAKVDRAGADKPSR